MPDLRRRCRSVGSPAGRTELPLGARHPVVPDTDPCRNRASVSDTSSASPTGHPVPPCSLTLLTRSMRRCGGCGSSHVLWRHGWEPVEPDGSSAGSVVGGRSTGQPIGEMKASVIDVPAVPGAEVRPRPAGLSGQLRHAPSARVPGPELAQAGSYIIACDPIDGEEPTTQWRAIPRLSDRRRVLIAPMSFGRSSRLAAGSTSIGGVELAQGRRVRAVVPRRRRGEAR
jgi:hypothetical protein